MFFLLNSFFILRTELFSNLYPSEVNPLNILIYAGITTALSTTAKQKDISRSIVFCSSVCDAPNTKNTANNFTTSTARAYKNLLLATAISSLRSASCERHAIRIA